MRTALRLLTTALAFICGCASPVRPQPGAARAPMPPAAEDSPAGPVRLPERMVIPATYRLVLLEGHFTLVREADPLPLAPAPTSLRVVAGEVARGELAYQPGLLPQELAAEVAANRESSARMDNALEAVMARSRELSGQAMELQAQSRRLAELLAAAQARVVELESRPHGAAEAPVTQNAAEGTGGSAR